MNYHANENTLEAVVPVFPQQKLLEHGMNISAFGETLNYSLWIIMTIKVVSMLVFSARLYVTTVHQSAWRKKTFRWCVNVFSSIWNVPLYAMLLPRWWVWGAKGPESYVNYALRHALIAQMNVRGITHNIAKSVRRHAKNARPNVITWLPDNRSLMEEMACWSCGCPAGIKTGKLRAKDQWPSSAILSV